MPWSMLEPVAFLKIAVKVVLEPTLMVAGLAAKLTMVGVAGLGVSGLPGGASIAGRGRSAGASIDWPASAEDASLVAASGARSGFVATSRAVVPRSMWPASAVWPPSLA